jgi:acyl carrier protein
MPDRISDDIRAVLGDYGRLGVDVASLADQTNLYEAGLTSHASVTLMLALEELRRGAFASIATIRASLEELIGAGA